MKSIVIIAIAVVCSIVTVLGVLIGLQLIAVNQLMDDSKEYQEQIEKEQQKEYEAQFEEEAKIPRLDEIKHQESVEFSGNSTLFTKFAYKKDFRNINGEIIPLEIHFKLKSDMQKTYDKIGFFNEKSNTIVIEPLFTSTAYWEPGFYTYYRNECGIECLTKKIEFEKPFGYSASEEGFKVLKLLNYQTISDYELAKNPKIIFEYDKVIVLHNEYITKEMFEAITNHPKVIYLYPNALYAEIELNFEENTITLIKGHNFPDSSVDNGFDWKFDNTQPYEFDTECENWEFYKIDNGVMLNCYPENIIFSDFNLLKKIKDY